MLAVRIHKTGGAEVFEQEELEIPSLGARDVRIRLDFIGVNFIDIYKRRGIYRSDLPAILGEEGAGIIDAVGEEVTSCAVGDRVGFVLHSGAYAEYITVPESRVVMIPEAMDSEVVAASLLQGLTAHFLTHSAFPIHAGHVVLVHAAAGGVGTFLVQMAKKAGAFVIGTVSTFEKEKLARELGADEVIRYTEVDFEDEVSKITANQGVHAVYDAVGKTTFTGSMDCLRPRGYLVLYGAASGPVPPVDPLLLSAKGSLFLTRASLYHYASNRDEYLWRVKELFADIASGDLRVMIDKVFPLADVGNAHQYLEDRRTKGKILLSP